MNIKEIREKYLKFYEKQGHSIVPSVSLIPQNDPTTLFTGSGMQPMMPYLLGAKHALGTRITDSQKCFRAQDIEEVGDNRHTTFFEMLGNWSFGDYFKKEQIPWIFSFLTDELGLDPERIYVTCFKGTEDIEKDTESATIWKEVFAEKGIEAKEVDNPETGEEGRIFYYDETKNWWSRAGIPTAMPEGEPGGPDSEMFWDFGAEKKMHENSPFKDEPCHVNCDCGRYLEIGNSVFMRYKKTSSGFEDLPSMNVDFGGGLERIGAAILDNPDVFMIDVFTSMREKIETLSGKTYNEAQQAYRVILDHLRAATFLIQDGAVPSNKDQGYFTRRLIRRAIRYGHTLGMKNFCAELATSVIASYDAYEFDEIMVTKTLQKEEETFNETLVQGLRAFEKIAEGKEALRGEEAFLLYQSYGFPIEMTEDLVEEKGMTLDKEGFEKAFEKHQDVSRQGAEKKFKGGLADSSEETTRLHTATHLLNEALREVISKDIKQRGSNITKERLRFDFNFDRKLTDEEKQKVEAVVNKKIEEGIDVVHEERPLQEALDAGYQAEFGHKYPDIVSTYTIGDFSKELCGGPHVKNTKEIGHFRIIKEESSAAGVRRIKAVVE